MIKYIEHDQIDKNKWDHCIANSFNGLVYAQSWYLDIVAQQWDALVEDDYIRVFPVIWRRKHGINYLYQPVFTQQLGVFSQPKLSGENTLEFLNAIPVKYKFAEINLNILNKIEDKKFQVFDWINHELDLIESYDNLSKNYSTNLKRNLKKANKAGLTVTQHIKPDEIIRIFRENKGKNLDGLNDDDYLKLRHLTYKGIYKGIVTTYGVYTETNDLCAGAIFLKSFKKVIFLFSGLTQQGREVNSMAFLIDRFIQENANNHLTFDFEGSNDKNLARFYKSFGSKEIHYPHIKLNRLPFPINVAVRIMKKFSR